MTGSFSQMNAVCSVSAAVEDATGVWTSATSFYTHQTHTSTLATKARSPSLQWTKPIFVKRSRTSVSHFLRLWTTGAYKDAGLSSVALPVGNGWGTFTTTVLRLNLELDKVDLATLKSFLVVLGTAWSERPFVFLVSIKIRIRASVKRVLFGLISHFHLMIWPYSPRVCGGLIQRITRLISLISVSELVY